MSHSGKPSGLLHVYSISYPQNSTKAEFFGVSLTLLANSALSHLGMLSPRIFLLDFILLTQIPSLEFCSVFMFPLLFLFCLH